MVNRLHNFGYRLCVYSGIRAMSNRCVHAWMSLTRDRSPNRGDHWFFESHCSESDIGRLKFCFFRRPRAATDLSGETYGMVSARLVEQPINAKLYRLICLTGHFGNGHFEAAFRFSKKRCTIFAIKNTARDNARFLGMNQLASKLTIGQTVDESVWLYRTFQQALGQYFDSVTLADPDQCVRLAVNPKLIKHPQVRTLGRIRKRYEYLSAAIAEETLC